MISEVLFEVRLPNVCFTTDKNKQNGVHHRLHGLTRFFRQMSIRKKKVTRFCTMKAHNSENLRSFNLGVPKNFPLFARKYINTRHD